MDTMSELAVVIGVDISRWLEGRGWNSSLWDAERSIPFDTVSSSVLWSRGERHDSGGEATIGPRSPLKSFLDGFCWEKLASAQKCTYGDVTNKSPGTYHVICIKRICSGEISTHTILEKQDGNMSHILTKFLKTFSRI